MRTNAIKLTDIPKTLLPVITSTKHGTIWLNGMTVKEIFIFRDNQYRIVTSNGEYRYGFDTDLELDIQT